MEDEIDPDEAFLAPPTVRFTEPALAYVREMHRYADENDMVLSILNYVKQTMRDPEGKIVRVKHDGLSVGCYGKDQVPPHKIVKVAGVPIVFVMKKYGPDQTLLIDLIDNDLAISAIM